MKKIALEEHFTTPLFFKYNQDINPFQDQLLELGERRLEAMDKALLAFGITDRLGKIDGLRRFQVQPLRELRSGYGRAQDGAQTLGRTEEIDVLPDYRRVGDAGERAFRA